MTTPGEAFVRAVGSRDFERAISALAPNVDFRALTPNRYWTADTPAEVLDVLKLWFEPGDNIDELLDVQCDAVADRDRVAYRMAVSNADGRFVVEQQAYYDAHEGAITWMRVLCSGWRPAPT